MSFWKSIAQGASEDRLEKLIHERLAPNSNKEEIDQRLWDLFGEEWCVMFTDLSGFSRHVSKFGIIHFLQTIFESQRLLIPVIEHHDGILLKTEGDSLLVIFRNVRKALDCSLKMQSELAIYNQKRDDEEKVLLCIGLGYGKVLRIGDSDVFGNEVNSASKLGEDTAKAGDILLTQAVKKMADSESAYKFEAVADFPPAVGESFRLIYSK